MLFKVSIHNKYAFYILNAHINLTQTMNSSHKKNDKFVCDYLSIRAPNISDYPTWAYGLTYTTYLIRKPNM